MSLYRDTSSYASPLPKLWPNVFLSCLSVPDAPDVWMWMNRDNTGQVIWKVRFVFQVNSNRFTTCSNKPQSDYESLLGFYYLVFNNERSVFSFLLSPFWHKEAWPLKISEILIKSKFEILSCLSPIPPLFLFRFFLASDTKTEPWPDHRLWSHTLELWRKCTAHPVFPARCYCCTSQPYTDGDLQRWHQGHSNRYCKEQRWVISTCQCHYTSTFDRYVEMEGDWVGCFRVYIAQVRRQKVILCFVFWKTHCSYMQLTYFLSYQMQSPVLFPGQFIRRAVSLCSGRAIPTPPVVMWWNGTKPSARGTAPWTG